MSSATKNDIHGGNVSALAHKLGLSEVPEIKYDFSVNLNPAGAPEAISDLIISEQFDWQSYPEPSAESAKIALANAHNIPSANVAVGNGATELFALILQSFRITKATFLAPAYSGYPEVCQKSNIEVAAVSSLDEDLADAVFIGYPNNPTGELKAKDELDSCIANNPETLFIIDESFMDFVEGAASYISSAIPSNAIVVKSLTKMFSIAGLRLGMLVANKDKIDAIETHKLPWSVNAISQAAAPLLYHDQDFLRNSQQLTLQLRNKLVDGLNDISGITVYPSVTNFVFIKSENLDLQKELLLKGIFIRSCEDFIGLEKGYFRIAVKCEAEIGILLDALTGKIVPDIHALSDKAIMVVGTTSNAGKSIVTSALCRYFYRKGYKVAPYKAQNMALNSFVTEEGGEMGRAQVVQAQAAKVKPHTDMNPVLLKPLGDGESQLIVNGKATGNFSAREYYEKKGHVRYDAWEAFDRLASRYDKVIMEGAGSPAEINLQDNDFVNMAAANHAKAKTILVADIDRGGVFASIFGTIKLIPKKYQHLIKGVIINKFRGDVTLLDSGIEKVEKLTGIPILGVLPYANNLMIEEEDSLGLENKATSNQNNKLIDIAVIRLPRMSNYTDFLPLETVPEVCLRYVSNPRELGTPDAIIIPGTKTTCSDMKFLRETGFEIKIKAAAKNCVPIIGICGGYQMLGLAINDPHGVEGGIETIAGLGLLDIETELQKEKELTQVSGIVTEYFPFAKATEQVPFIGYEIHAGQTQISTDKAPLVITKCLGESCNTPIGTVSDNNLVFGCYIHGIFDCADTRNAFVNYFMNKKGIEANNVTDYDPDAVYEQLADMIEAHIDMSEFE